MNSLNAWFITVMKVLGAFDNPKGMTNNSDSPTRVLNVAFYLSLGRLLIWWKPLFKSKLLNMVAP